MINVALVRGKYLNNFELQNYNIHEKDIAITAISSQHPIDVSITLPLIKLQSIADYSNRFTERLIKIISNRTIGDSQILFGLENYANKFDIFHTADPHYYYSYQLARLRQKNSIKKLIVTSWETIPFNNESLAKKKFIKNFTKEYTDYFVCYTQKASETLKAEGVRAEKIRRIHLGVDLNRFKPFENKNKDFTILFVGRLVLEKGILDVYEAFKTIKNKKVKNKKIVLQIVGKGPVKSYMQRVVKKDHLTDQISIETRDYEDMSKLYQKADIFIAPSKRTATWEEQLGMVFMEAMACGLPIITYDTGAIAEVVDDAGLVLKENDILGLGKTLDSLIHDEFKRQLYAMKARKRAEKYFDSKKTAKELEQLYRNM